MENNWNTDMKAAENHNGKYTRWFMGRLKDGTEVPVHFAQDLSGEEQPPFKGFFKDNGSYMAGVDLKEWRPFEPFEGFKFAVVRESKHYSFLKKYNGQFNDEFLKVAFDAGQSPMEFCNSMTEVV